MKLLTLVFLIATVSNSLGKLFRISKSQKIDNNLN